MPRWFSVIALAAVLVIVLHTLISFYQPTLAPWGRPPADIIKSPGNPIDEGKNLNVPESHEYQPSAEKNTHTPETTHTEHVEEVEDLGPKGHEILLIVGSNGKSRSNIDGMEDMVRENRLQYVELHGYDFTWANFSEHRVGNAHPVWSKVPALKDAFEKHPQAKWVWWLDLDAIIMTPEIDLAAHLLDPKVLFSILRKGEAYHLRGTNRPGIYHTSETPDPNQINMIISGDHNGINAGSFFLRRSTWTEMFLDLWLDPFYVENVWPGQEQDAIIHMIQHHAFVREHVGIVPQRTLNAYSEGSEEMRWQPKDLVIHFAGCWVRNNCAERWFEFWQKREIVPGKEYTVLEASPDGHEAHVNLENAAMQHTPRRRRRTTN